MLDGTGAVLAGIAALVSAILLGAPSGVKAYVDLVTFRDKREHERGTKSVARLLDRDRLARDGHDHEPRLALHAGVDLDSA